MCFCAKVCNAVESEFAMVHTQTLTHALATDDEDEAHEIHAYTERERGKALNHGENKRRTRRRARARTPLYLLVTLNNHERISQFNCRIE